MEAGLLELAKTVGPTAALLVFAMLWLKGMEQKRETRDTEREDRQTKRLDTIQDRYANVMETLVKDHNVAMNKLTDAVNGVTRVVQRCPRGRDEE